jgi:hypothetical protein
VAPPFWNALRTMRRRGKATLKQLPKLGERAPICYEVLGMTLALLDCASTCCWGCAGGDHRLEYLVGRAAKSAYAALNLAVKSYYDQSLSLARTLGEIANLMSLFCLNTNALAEWKTATEAHRDAHISYNDVFKLAAVTPVHRCRAEDCQLPAAGSRTPGPALHRASPRRRGGDDEALAAT